MAEVTAWHHAPGSIKGDAKHAQNQETWAPLYSSIYRVNSRLQECFGQVEEESPTVTKVTKPGAHCLVTLVGGARFMENLYKGRETAMHIGDAICANTKRNPADIALLDHCNESSPGSVEKQETNEEQNIPFVMRRRATGNQSPSLGNTSARGHT